MKRVGSLLLLHIYITALNMLGSKPVSFWVYSISLLNASSISKFFRLWESYWFFNLGVFKFGQNDFHLENDGFSVDINYFELVYSSGKTKVVCKACF